MNFTGAKRTLIIFRLNKMPRAKKNNILKNLVQNFFSIFNLELRKK